MPLVIYSQKPIAGLVVGGTVIVFEHLVKAARYLPASKRECKGKGFWRKLFVAFGAGSVLSAQEVTRVQAALHRFSLYSLCRRVDWFDGQEPRIRLDIQFGSMIRFVFNIGLTCFGFGSIMK